MASQLTSLRIVYSTNYSGADQRKHQSSSSLAFVRGIHRWPVNYPHKGPVTRQIFPSDNVIMCTKIYSGKSKVGEWQYAKGPSQKYRGGQNKKAIKRIEYSHSFAVVCFLVVISTDHMDYRDNFSIFFEFGFTDSGTIIRLPQLPRSNSEGYG